jgi:PAS domain S-box-containing protein
VGLAGDRTGWAVLFWAAFEHSTNAMALLRSDRVLVAMNQAWRALFGYEPSDVIGSRADMFVAPESQKAVELDWATLQRSGQVAGEREMRTATGRRLRVQFAAQREVVTGEQFVLWVTLEAHVRPLSRDTGDATKKRLTPRELEIVCELSMGLRMHEIADRLFISQHTVARHVRNAMAKVGARSQAQLVAITMSSGMLHPDYVHGQMSESRKDA